VQLIVRNAEVEGVGVVDVAIRDGRIVSMEARISAHADDEIDARGAALIPGLWDHHVHLFALAASHHSVSLAGLSDRIALVDALHAADRRLPPGVPLRAVGYDDSVAGSLDRSVLDPILSGRPVRVQYRTGGIWALNSAAIIELGPGPYPPGVLLNADGTPTGRIVRSDDWLRHRLLASPPRLDRVAADCERFGIIGLTDTSVTNDDDAAHILRDAARAAGMRQELLILTGNARDRGRGYRLGPVKIVLDDDRLGDPADIARVIADAHAADRAAAIHCVTLGELAVALAAFEQAGARRGDRIEHGGLVTPDAAESIRDLGLTVVTQPGFIADRGDRYRAQVDPSDQPYLYPCGSLQALGIAVAGSSDAPYATFDPWAAMRAAVTRQTRDGFVLGAHERIAPRAALGLWLGRPEDPGRAERRVAVGLSADLCLLHRPFAEMLEALSADLVRATIVRGAL
jgi:predicted amidohydrolase YtcJ